jgi:hypothetical protein
MVFIDSAVVVQMWNYMSASRQMLGCDRLSDFGRTCPKARLMTEIPSAWQLHLPA